MTCPNLPSCTLPNALQASLALRVWHTLYCESSWRRCERLKLFRAGSLVPPNLMPNGSCLGASSAREAKRP
jgi:hypothetical protein